MMKWINTAVFLLLVYAIVYKGTNQFLKNFLIDEENDRILLILDSDTETTVKFSYNLIPHFATEDLIEFKIKKGENQILLPILEDQGIESIYMISNDPINGVIKSITAKSKLGTYFMQLAENIKHFSTQPFYIEKNNRVKLELYNEEIPFILNADQTILSIENGAIKGIYKFLNSKIKTVSTIASLLILIIALIYYFKQSKLKFKPSYQANFCALFILMLFIPLFSENESKSSENRALAKFPDLNINIWKIPKRYNAFYNDRFPFKNSINKTYNNLFIKTFNSSPIPQHVQIGKDNWLFYSKKELQKIFRGIDIYTPEELESIKNKLEIKRKLLAEKNIVFYLMIPPSKPTIYFEYLPRNLHIISHETKRKQLIDYLRNSSSILVVDSYHDLMQLKQSYTVYYETDTHWNRLGAFKAYQNLIQAISDSFPSVGKSYDLNDFKISNIERPGGDLNMIMNTIGTFTFNEVILEPKKPFIAKPLVVDNHLGNGINCMYFGSEKLASKPRLLMYRDSFSEHLYPLLSEHFSYSCFAWTHEMNEEHIQKTNPDVVVLELMERFIDRLL